MQSQCTTHKPRIGLTNTRGTYRVQSSTDPRVVYTTTAASCTCPAGAHGKACKHSRAVKRLNAVFYAPKASKRPMRPAGMAGMAALQECYA